MIRSEHAIVHYDFRHMMATADRLRRKRDDVYLSIAEQLIGIYVGGVSKSRQELHQEVTAVMRRVPGCPPRRVNAFCKLLDDASEFGKGRSAAKLRQTLFANAARFHPIVQHPETMLEHSVADVQARLAKKLKQPWDQIQANLFSDVLELQRLESFDSNLQAADLLSRYNLAQAQAMLYRTQSAQLTMRGDYKVIVSAIKLAGLMHRIERIEPPHQESSPVEYQIQLDGPQSNLRETTRYGVRFAQLLATLVRCRDWHFTANLGGHPAVARAREAANCRNFRCQIRSSDGLKGAASAGDGFDSDLERQINECWQAAPIPGWSWTRETDLLCMGQTVYTPDFSLRQPESFETIYVEVVGYWTPEYLAEKRERLEQFIAYKRQNSSTAKWLLIFPSRTSADRLQRFQNLDVGVTIWKKGQSPRRWLEAVGIEAVGKPRK